MPRIWKARLYASIKQCSGRDISVTTKIQNCHQHFVCRPSDAFNEKEKGCNHQCQGKNTIKAGFKNWMSVTEGVTQRQFRRA